MSLQQLVYKERFESIRTLIASLQTTVLALQQNFWSIYSFHSSKSVPPFIYPTMTFYRLQKVLSDLLDQTLKSKTSNIVRVFVSQNQLERDANSLLSVVVRLYASLTQRIAGTGIMKQIETHNISQFEQGTSIKSYQAVDALSFDLVERILGKQWITKNSYIPFSIFDSGGYSINPVSFVATLPYPDTFRSRFWPVMAHEISHILVNQEAESFSSTQSQINPKPQTIGELLFYSIEELMDILNLPKTKSNFQIAFDQLTELFCDIIATYTCPILFITGSLHLPHYLETKGYPLLTILQNTTHPPSDSRIIAMRTVLQKNNILKTDDTLNNYVNAVCDINETKNKHYLSLESLLLLEKYNDFAMKITSKILPILHKLPIKSIKKSDWSKLLQRSTDLLGQSPVLAMNVLWQKRLRIITKSSKFKIMDYYILRQNENQLLENFINSAYGYYVNEIFPRVEGDRYDIRINTC